VAGGYVTMNTMNTYCNLYEKTFCPHPHITRCRACMPEPVHTHTHTHTHNKAHNRAALTGVRSYARCGRCIVPRDCFLWNPRDLTVWIMRHIRSHNEAGERKKPKGKESRHSYVIRQRAGHETIKIETVLCIPRDNWHQKASCCMAEDIISIVWTTFLDQRKGPMALFIILVKSVFSIFQQFKTLWRLQTGWSGIDSRITS